MSYRPSRGQSFTWHQTCLLCLWRCSLQDQAVKEKHQTIRNELTAVLDTTRLQAHLLSMDAQAKWKKLEKKLLVFEKKLDQETLGLTSAALDKVKGITFETRKFFQEQALLAPELRAPISSVLNASGATCTGGESANAVAQVLWDSNLSALPVVDSDDQPIGVLTDRDLCMAVYTQGKRLQELTVQSAMNTQFECCAESCSIREAVEAMAKHAVQRLVVVDNSGKLVGLLTLAQLTRNIYESTGGLSWVSPTIARLLSESNVK